MFFNKLIRSKLILLFILIHGYVNACDISLDQALQSPDANYQRNQAILQNVSTTKKGTVGVILVHQKDEKLFILLGKEKQDDQTPEKSGCYCDLDGSIEDDTILNNMLRELKEESMGLYSLDPEKFLKNCITFTKHIEKQNRNIFYSIYKIDDAEYIDAFTLNEYSKAQSKLDKNKRLPAEYLEKDEYQWVDTASINATSPDDKLPDELMVNNIYGRLWLIKLRKYFVDDCLNNPDSKKIIDYYRQKLPH